MKKLFNLLMIALCVFATACSDDDDDPKPIPFTADPAALTFNVEGGSQKVTLSLEGAIAAPDKDWCTVVVNKAEATVTVTANEETQIRTAKVTFTAGEQTVNVTVTQAGKEASVDELTPEKTQVDFTAEGGEEVVKVTATATFTAASSESWLTATAAEGKVTLNATANTAEARTAKVTLTMGEKTAEITVNQAAPFKADYNSYIGTWKVKGTTDDGRVEYNNVIITAKENGKSYNVAGWTHNAAAAQQFPLTMHYQSDGSVVIKGHQELLSEGEGTEMKVLVVAGVFPYNNGYSLLRNGEIGGGETEGHDVFMGKYDGNELKMIGQDAKTSVGTFKFGALKYYMYQYNSEKKEFGFYYLTDDNDGYAWDPVMTKVSNNTSSVNSISGAFPSVEKLANPLPASLSAQ